MGSRMEPELPKQIGPVAERLRSRGPANWMELFETEIGKDNDENRITVKIMGTREKTRRPSELREAVTWPGGYTTYLAPATGSQQSLDARKGNTPITPQGNTGGGGEGKNKLYSSPLSSIKGHREPPAAGTPQPRRAM